MRKNLFLACALVLASFVGLSAQTTWHRTLAGIVGDQITSKETYNEAEVNVTHYHVTTPVISLPEAVKGLRLTVFKTAELNQIKGGGPTFALGELIIRDADGKKIAYTAKSNADHNTLTGSPDGQGLPALNDGLYSTYFHSVWNDSKSPSDAHYIEVTFESASLDKVQLEWYTRPNQHQNRPIEAGISSLGHPFTEDMLFSEFGFATGDVVTKLADIEAGFYTLYAEDLSNGESFPDVTPNGHTYVALSGYTTGKSTEATPAHIVQFVPAENEGEFILYQPLNGTFYADAGYWTDGFSNGVNGWQRASTNPLRLQRVKFTERTDGEFEMSYILDEYYRNVDGETVNETENPIEVWIGYDMRGNLKLFPKGEKDRLEEALDSRNFSGGSFGLPVDFGFKLNKAKVNDGVIAPLTLDMLAGKEASTYRSNLIARMEKVTEFIPVYEEWYNEWVVKAGQSATHLTRLNKALVTAQGWVDNADASAEELAAANDDLDSATGTYIRMLFMLVANTEVKELNKDENFTSTYEEGKYPMSAKALLTEIEERARVAAGEIQDGYMTVNEAYNELTEVWAMREAFFAKKLAARVALPIVVEPTADGQLPGATVSGNHMIWEQFAIVKEPVNGIRLTVLESIGGNANPTYNGYPMVALGEIEIYDGEGEKIALTADNFAVSSYEMNEHNGGSDPAGPEYLCDGAWEGAGTFYHSVWGNKNEGGNIDTYPWIEISFPETIGEFTIKVISRDKSTTGNTVSLFPKEIAITNLGEEYDPVVFSENEYNVQQGELVTSLSQITDDGIYAIRGLLETHPTYAPTEDDETKARGTAYWFKDVTTFHKSVLRAEVAYLIQKDGETYNVHSLATGKYWPAHKGMNAETGRPVRGYVSSTPYKEKAAKLYIAPAEGDAVMANTWVLYEHNDELQDTIIKTSAEGDRKTTVQTPYAVYMHWAGGLAIRAVQNPAPGVGVDFDNMELDITTAEQDAWGDSLHFNKKNGEGQWQIYKITMDTPNTYWLANLYETTKAAYNYRFGSDPGMIDESAADQFVAALADAKACVEDSVSTAEQIEATAKVVARALLTAQKQVEAAERTPMAAGDYMLVSALAAFKEKLNIERAIGVMDNASKEKESRWINATDATIDDFTWTFAPSPYTKQLGLSEEEAKNAYILKNKGTGKYLATMAEVALSTKLPLSDVEAMAETFIVQEVAGSSAFVLAPATKKAWAIHAQGHASGAGKNGEVVYWSDKTAGASQWFIISPDSYETSIENLLDSVEGDEVVSVSYFTAAGTSVPAPVQGVNVVVVVYANGVVETKKVLVK